MHVPFKLSHMVGMGHEPRPSRPADYTWWARGYSDTDYVCTTAVAGDRPPYPDGPWVLTCSAWVRWQGRGGYCEIIAVEAVPYVLPRVAA